MKRPPKSIPLPEYILPAGENAWRLLVWVQPGAKTSGPAGLYDDRLKIRLVAPAVDNKANEALVQYVAGILNLKKRQVCLESGHTGRGKTLLVTSDTEPSWPDLAKEAF